MDELTYEMILKSWKESAKISEASEDKELDMQCKEMVEKAIEKQIPMEVKEIHVDEYYCPACGSENNCSVGIVEDDYCPRCGQMLAKETDC